MKYSTLELDNLDTTNRFKLIQLLGGKCRICLNDKIESLEVDHIYNDGAEERSKYGSVEKIYAWYLQHPEQAFRRLQPLCKDCHSMKTYAINKSLDESIIELGSLQGMPPEISKLQIFMNVLKTLEGDLKKPVDEKLFVDELVKTTKFTLEEARNFIRRMLREATIYESKPGYYNRI
ncbi:MAG: hypothetical protein QXY22_01305 [Candidatus Nitrosotenuis sp.]